MLSLEGVSDDVARFSNDCEGLLSALGRHTRFSETEKALISYDCQEIMIQTQSLRDEYENQ